MNNERDEKLSHTEREHNCSHTEGHDHDYSCDGHHCCHTEGHDHDHSCDGHHCCHDHHQTISIKFDDGTELDCPILDIFEVSGQDYIAIIHPIEETALLYRFFDNEDGTVNLTPLEGDAEYKVVTETFMALLEEES